MLHVYYGTDRQQVRDAAAEFQSEQLPPDSTVTTIDAQSFAPGQVADALGAASLFGGLQWFVIDTPSDNPELQEEVQASLPEMQDSPNTFIALEGALLAAAKKSYAKHATTMAEFAAAKAAAANPFALGESLAQKDRRQLWVLYQDAKHRGDPAEKIIGLLWWQLKSLRLAEVTSNASEAGMKDFPYNKAKRALAKFAPGEVTQLSHSLLELYHDGHAGVRDIDLALERWVLGGK